jgi:1-deoxy-D-xylulose-5-phosphate synthase
VGKFDPSLGVGAKAGGRPTYTDIFSDWLTAMAEAEPRLVGITPAMREGSGLVDFAERFPERYFDVGIAEQHALTFAAGLACEGRKPVVAIYSTFLQRAYDQLIHDVALQNLPVLLAIDRGGLVGADGPTHAGAYDLSFLRCVPNLLVATPSDEEECRRLLTTAFLHSGPSAVRYPRGTGPGAELTPGLLPLPVGRGVIRRSGKGVAILAFGPLVASAMTAAEALDATVADMRFVKPLDLELIRRLAEGHDLLVTVEENALQGGAGSAVAEALAGMGLDRPIRHLGLPDRFIEQGEHAVLLTRCGLDAAGIEAAVAGFARSLKHEGAATNGSEEDAA